MVRRRMWRLRFWCVVAITVLLWLFGIVDFGSILRTVAGLGGWDGWKKTPNIILILTDDQDLHMDSLEYMPFLQKHLVEEGTTYDSHYCTISICCPSRVSLLTGKAAHNTNVTDVQPPYGGYPKFIKEGLNENYLPIWMQEKGYATYYTGKLMNAHSIDTYNHPFAKGWNEANFLLDPQTYTYVKSVTQRNDQPPRKRFGEYSTDIVAHDMYEFLNQASGSSKPFFMVAAPIAPHATFEVSSSGGMRTYAPIPARRHRHLFQDARIPRSVNFNPDRASGVDWIHDLAKQSNDTVDGWDEFYRQRLRALQAVDEMIDGVVQRLTEYKLLDNTYIFYSTDNGYHIGQHRIGPGKECGFEEDIHIPMIVRGPGVPAGEITELVTTHTDLAPTFLSIANAELRSDFDGTPMPLTDTELYDASRPRSETVNVEFWGISFDELNADVYPNNTYKALRLIGEEYSFYYAVWCSNSHELYDLKIDPGQLHNLYPVAVSHPDHPLAQLIHRLDALLLVLKSCKGSACTQPWRVLHPRGDVKSISDALITKYDTFYATQSRVSFSRCELGYLEDAEGPMMPNIYDDYMRWDNLLRV